MFVTFFGELEAAGVPVTLREYLTLMEAMQADLAGRRVEDFYYLSRAALVKDERNLDKFDRVFGHVFKGLALMEDALTAEIPEEWLKKLAERFLTEEEKRQIEALGGLDKLLETLKERLAEQKGRHQGGKKWIGTGGTSPFGNGGYNPEGIRIGGEGKQKRAVKVWDKREFKDLADDVELGTRNIKVALRRLRKFARTGAPDELDLDDTIKGTAHKGYLDIVMRPERHNAVKVLMFYDIGGCVIPCNYLQIMENSLDPVHVEWLHVHFSNYVLERLGRQDLRRQGWNNNQGDVAQHKLIKFDTFDYGILKKRIMDNTDENHPYWTMGHPIVFPNILKTTGFQYRVPIDDENTYHWWLFPYKLPEGIDMALPQDKIPYYDVPMPSVLPNGRPTWDLLDNNSGQDITAWITQGQIADRTQETLGRSDRGIIMYRQQLRDALKDIAEGRDPMCVFRDPSVKRVDFATESAARFAAGGARSRRACRGAHPCR